jgi:hypothetical protein
LLVDATNNSVVADVVETPGGFDTATGASKFKIELLANELEGVNGEGGTRVASARIPRHDNRS